MGEPGEPLISRLYVRASRDAAREVWGEEGLADVARRMPEPERKAFFADPLPEWVPERAMLAWGFASWEGPGQRSRRHYVPWLHRMTDLSFGRIKKILLGMANPARVLLAADELWREGHTHGRMEVHIDGTRATMLLRDSPYVPIAQGRASIAENIRYIVELSRAKGVTETHGLANGALQIKLQWMR
jgi:hypothetical protein